ncbi:hypothetical protein ALP29_00241 [Pseudomonas syringae pv. avii]|uniref:Uncharacterized protein n=1 Tax=Pseudomonas syringae pv. avii TaxID=663959 RepID=A0A3M5VHX5_PSESX|nr:hypothetical protein [Pseudomonas azotoformans]RMT61691.1 hypothetical protein ALP43_03233 [Pseudomonas azotoformans]RMU57761.1 hypothetical protein ALP29_00241 [Pseudomonas syringae pv. avii]
MNATDLHMRSTPRNQDRLNEQQLRDELKRVTEESLNDVLLIIELRGQVEVRDQALVKLAKLQLAGNGSDIQRELQRLASCYEHKMAVEAARVQAQVKEQDQ